MKRLKTLKYLLADLISVSVAWLMFNILRYHLVGSLNFSTLSDYLELPVVLWGQLVAIIVAIVIFYYSGYYNYTHQKSRLTELLQTFYSCLLSAIILFFVIIINDLPKDYTTYYMLLSALFLLLFFLVYIPRIIITQRFTKKVHSRKIGFNTIVIGAGHKAASLIEELNSLKLSLGYHIVGCVTLENSQQIVNSQQILGSIDEIEELIANHHIEEIIVALDSKDDKVRLNTIYTLFKFNLPIKITPLKFDIFSGNIRMNTIYATPLIDVSLIKMEAWQKNIKNSIDRVISLFVLIFLSPLFAYICFRIKRDSKGPLFYRQVRLGYRGHPFKILKFRSMYLHDEEFPPRLSNDHDERITPFGKIMRKYRLDELPQFWNVLKGDMSIVGPRPEQPYYVDQIVKKAPFYILLHKVKPGITSWGMVKYGYATNVNEMIRRLEYDLIYIENCSLFIDIKILIYTTRTVFTGRGV